MNDLIEVFNKSVIITIFVFVMVLLIDYINVFTRGRMEQIVKGGRGRQYLTASFLGVTPGCLGAFMNVSFYVHGLLSFGAIVGGMIATSGDEAFIMLALFPKDAVILFGILFFLGVVGALVADRFASYFGIVPCTECDLQEVHDIRMRHYFHPAVLRRFSHLSPARYLMVLFFMSVMVANIAGIWGPQEWSWDEPERMILVSLSIIALFTTLTVSEHYFTDHIWKHIVKKHVWKVFLWTFFAMLFITIGLRYWDLEEFVMAHMGMVLLISAIVGMIPESGPHMVFVVMYAHGIVPFSILLTSSIVQDGHGMLPLFSYTVRDSVYIKLFNLIFALVVGGCFYLLGS